MCHIQNTVRLGKGVTCQSAVKAHYVQNSKAMHGVSAAESLVLTVKALDSARALRQTARILARRWTINMGAKAAESSRVERPAAAICLFTLPCKAPIVPKPRISSRCLHAPAIFICIFIFPLICTYSLGCGASCDSSDTLAGKHRCMWCATVYMLAAMFTDEGVSSFLGLVDTTSKVPTYVLSEPMIQATALR